jgi:hypothetical protein
MEDHGRPTYALGIDGICCRSTSSEYENQPIPWMILYWKFNNKAPEVGELCPICSVDSTSEEALRVYKLLSSYCVSVTYA